MARYIAEAIDRRKADQFAYVNDTQTGDIAKAFAGPTAIADAEQWAAVQNGETQDDDLIHWWSSEIGRLALCGLDVLHTPYSYGSPEWSEVTCQACKLAG